MLDARPNDGAHLVFDAPVTEEACFGLWGAVIRQMAMDASGPTVVIPTEKRPQDSMSNFMHRVRHARQAQTNQRKARAWFRGPDFREICWMCGIDPQTVLHDLRQNGYDIGG